SCVIFCCPRHHPSYTLFPYTTLFRSELEVRIEQCVAEQRAADARIEKHLVDNTEFNDQLSEIQGRYYGLGSDIARLEQSIEHHIDRKSTRLNSSHVKISYAVFCLKKK